MSYKADKSEKETKYKTKKEKSLITVYVVYNSYVSYQNGGYKTEIYVCKDKKSAEEQAEDCHKEGMCAYDSFEEDSDRLEVSNNKSYRNQKLVKINKHTYKECKEKEQRIWINEKHICMADDVIMSLDVRT